MTDLAYILSASYSGSTLLTLVLGAHPEMGTVGELKATAMGNTEEYVCSCGAKMIECPFWTAVRAELDSRGVAFDVAHFGTHFLDGRGALTDRLLRGRYRGGAFEMARSAALRLLPHARGGCDVSWIATKP